MNNKFKILIIEDDLNICNIVKTILETNGYQVIDANNGKNGKIVFLSHRPDLVILDLGLPDVDGIEIIREIREQSDTPIIVLSARTDELLARVRATLRNNRRNANGEKISRTKFVTADMEIDYEFRKITIAGTLIKLTQIEYNIVELLSINAGRVLTYSEIIKKIWGYADSGSIKKLQVNMANIRKKLGETPGENKYISNELGVGYRMNVLEIIA